MAKKETKKVTNAERIEALKAQQEQLKEAFIKLQGVIEMLESIDNEGK